MGGALPQVVYDVTPAILRVSPSFLQPLTQQLPDVLDAC